MLFLTDGLPTEGEIDEHVILTNVDAAAPDNVRLFVFGVGDDVDTILLDSLVAGANRRQRLCPSGRADR